MRLTRKAFDQLVEEAIASLPEEFARWIDEVPVIVEDRPGKADALPEDDDGPPLGMFTGPAMGEAGDAAHLPARIMLYREPLMEACASREALAEEIRKTLLHEIGHFTGMDEDQLDALGYGPLKEPEDIEWDVDDDDSR